MTIFRIPVMRIQDAGIKIESHPDLMVLEKWVIAKIAKERSNWGIRGKGYSIKFDLEQKWYPIFIFVNRWMADAFVQHLGKFFKDKN